MLHLGLGAILYQHQDDKLRVIAYASRTLSQAEKNYHLHSGKLEFIAVKWSISDAFRDYLYYTPNFTVYTDYNPLTYITTSAKLNATTQRWLNELIIIIIRLTCQFHLKWVAQLLCLF